MRLPQVDRLAASRAWFVALMPVIALSGASVARAAEAPPAVGQMAKDFELTALDGKSVKLSTLNDAGPVVLVVLRGYPGYQCPICSKQFAELIGKADEFKSLGAQVVFVYPGPADQLKAHADEFVQGRAYPDNFRILLDPAYSFTNAYGLRWDAPKETAYPSTFVIDPQGKITFAQVSKTHGGRSKVADVIGALGSK